MPDDKEDIKASYPLPVYNYRVTIHDGGDPVVAGFSEVSGLNVEYEPVTYKHGLSFLLGNKIIPGMRQPIRITLKRGIVRERGSLQKWFDKTYSDPFYMEAKRDIVIDLCDEAGEAVVRWKVRKALPVKMDAPAFDADSNDIAVETMELVAADVQVDYKPG